MAKFVDGDGVERELVLTVGLLEDVQAAHGIDVDTAFMDADALGKLLYGGTRRLAAILATLCGLDAAAAKAFSRSLNKPALDRAREALLVALADFSLPPGAAAEYRRTIPAMLTGAAPSASSATATASPA